MPPKATLAWASSTSVSPGQSVQRAGAAAGKLMKGLVDPSTPKRIRIRKRDVSAPPRARAACPRGPRGADGMVRQCRNNMGSANMDGRRSTAASVAVRASATIIASAASAGTVRERRGASTIASGPRKFRPACMMPCLHPGAPYAQAVAALLAWVISACSLL